MTGNPIPATAAATPAPRTWEKITLFAFGTFFVIVLLMIAWFDRQPSTSSWYIYICVLAIAVGGVAALLPGAINVEINPGLRGGGALALAALVIWFGKELAPSPPPPVSFIEGLSSHLDFPSPVDPQNSDVYVYINAKLAAVQCPSGRPELFGAPTNQATIHRDWGGISVGYNHLKQGDRVWIAAKDPNGNWWKSNDLVVPQGELTMNGSNLVAVQARTDAP